MALTIDLESLPVLIVPGKHRLLLKDLICASDVSGISRTAFQF